mmetsp:Transcript_36539/g.61552  ORF Transcript_36539/g.61552 Transcript_36539/m.61552 type:complete len:618 (-) Transcript_36539:82-1935(-)
MAAFVSNTSMLLRTPKAVSSETSSRRVARLSARRSPQLMPVSKHGKAAGRQRLVTSAVASPAKLDLESMDDPLMKVVPVAEDAMPRGIRDLIAVSMPTMLNTDLGSVMDAPHCSMLPKKTHIICTLGPASRTVEQLVTLLDAGMSIARFNFSHGTHEYHLETLVNLRAACEQTGKLCGVLLDTKGPEIRTGTLKNGQAVQLVKGQRVTLTSDYTVEGDSSTIAISYANIARDLKLGSQVLMADGNVMMEVDEIDEAAGTVTCVMLNSASLGERKNCNLPGVKVDLPTLTEKDVSDLVDFGVKHNVDFIAASFVRKASDVMKIREVLGEAGKNIRIISKVENHEGLENFDEILDKSDGIMVARGDLGMEIPLTKIFWVQKMMIRKCNMVGKPVITATQMLDSMITAPRPTRAEATDVANAVLDGTDCVMLSGETAAGAYPVNAVEVMSGICEEAEECIDNYALCQSLLHETLTSNAAAMSTIESLASSAVLTAAKVKAAVIVVLAANGNAARYIAKYRPVQPVIVGVVPRNRRVKIGFEATECSSETVARQCLLTRGLVPVVISKKEENEDGPTAAKNCVLESIEYARAKGLVQKGDRVVSMYNVEKQCAVIRVLVVD